MLDGEVFLYYIAFHVSDKLNSHIPHTVYLKKLANKIPPSFANDELAKNVQQLPRQNKTER